MNGNLEKRFVYGSKGNGVCSGGTLITDEKSCREACKALNLQEGAIHGNDVCYKRGYNRKCYQDGQQGAGAYLICETSYHSSGKSRKRNKNSVLL